MSVRCVTASWQLDGAVYATAVAEAIVATALVRGVELSQDADFAVYRRPHRPDDRLPASFVQVGLRRDEALGNLWRGAWPELQEISMYFLDSRTRDLLEERGDAPVTPADDAVEEGNEHDAAAGGAPPLPVVEEAEQEGDEDDADDASSRAGDESTITEEQSSGKPGGDHPGDGQPGGIGSSTAQPLAHREDDDIEFRATDGGHSMDGSAPSHTPSPARSPSHRSREDDMNRTEEELMEAHDASQARWTRQPGDAISEVEVALLLATVHPAYMVENECARFLAAVGRAALHSLADSAGLLAAGPQDRPIDAHAIAAAARSWIPEPMLRRCLRAGRAAVSAFAMVWEPPPAVTVRVRLLEGPHLLHLVRMQAAVDEMLVGVAEDAARSLRVEPRHVVSLWRGSPLPRQGTPRNLLCPKTCDLFLVNKQWWAKHRREEARRGLLTSTRFNDATVQSIRNKATSRVAPMSTSPVQLPRLRQKREARRRGGGGGALDGSGELGGGGRTGEEGADQEETGFKAGRRSKSKRMRLIASPGAGEPADLSRLEHLDGSTPHGDGKGNSGIQPPQERRRGRRGSVEGSPGGARDLSRSNQRHRSNRYREIPSSGYGRVSPSPKRKDTGLSLSPIASRPAKAAAVTKPSDNRTARKASRALYKSCESALPAIRTMLEEMQAAEAVLQRVPADDGGLADPHDPLAEPWRADVIERAISLSRALDAAHSLSAHTMQVLEKMRTRGVLARPPPRKRSRDGGEHPPKQADLGTESHVERQPRSETEERLPRSEEEGQLSRSETEGQLSRSETEEQSGSKEETHVGSEAKQVKASDADEVAALDAEQPAEEGADELAKEEGHHQAEETQGESQEGQPATM